MTTTLTWPAWPQSDARTMDALREVLDSGRWAISGPFAGEPTREQRFAEAFARFCGVPHCVTLDHGTSALISALEALDVGHGDEVIVPGLTWVAPAIAVLSVNAVPVVVDVEPDTFCLSVERAREAITPRTKAILPVHLYGCMVQMDDLLSLAAEHGVSVVEDAAHSHGSEWRGRKAGSMGRVGIFSLQQGKVLTCGEGGCAITSEAALRERIESSAWNSRARARADATRVGDMQLVATTPRFATNRCLSEFQAAVLLDQLPRLDAQNAARERAARLLDERLGEIPGIATMRRHAPINRQTYYGYVVRVDPARFGMTAEDVVLRLKARLGMRDFLLHATYKPLPSNPFYAPHPRRHALGRAYEEAISPARARVPECERAFETGVVFHHSVLLADDAHLDAIVGAFRELCRAAA